MISPGLAFTLAYLPAKLAAIDETRALLDWLAADLAVAGDRELKHAVEFAEKATQIEREIAAPKLAAVIASAAASGLNLPNPPVRAVDWSAWRSEVEVAISATVDGGGRLASALGQRAFDLMFAWSRAERIAYLRAARADHPMLVEAATQRVPEVAAGWAELDRAVRSSGRPLLEIRRELLTTWMTHAPAADAVKSNSYRGGAFAEMIRWIRGLDGLCENFARDLNVPVDAPPSRPASAEEQRLVEAIVANPDDDGLRHRFAELAAERGDARATLVREQYAMLEDPSAEVYPAYIRVAAHPEWSAPLTALGARDVKFTRGFPSEITIDLDALLANANELFSLAPITTLRVRGGLAGRGAELAALPQLATLTELDLVKQGVTDANLEALVQSSRLTRLRTLILHQNSITAVGVDALAAATHTMPALTSVDLQLNVARNPVDQSKFYDETNQHYVPTAEGKALEAKYGRLRWLHPDE